jgi:hypothetical protein
LFLLRLSWAEAVLAERKFGGNAWGGSGAGRHEIAAVQA